jgi:hypothetical protein
MDWLRSEDLKEENMVNRPSVTITRPRRTCLIQIDLKTFRIPEIMMYG